MGARIKEPGCAAFWVVAKELLGDSVVVKTTPHGGARGASASNCGLAGTSNKIPARIFAVDFNECEVIPDITGNEDLATCGGLGVLPKGAIAEGTEEFDAHEGAVSTGQVHIVEHHGVVPVLSVSTPLITGGIRPHVSSPHEVGWVFIIRRKVLTGISGTNGMVGLQMPICGAVNVFLERPRTTRCATGFHFGAVPVVGVNGGVG